MIEKEIDWELFEKLIWIPVLTTGQLSDMLGCSIRTLERRVKDKFSLTIAALRDQKQGPMRHKLFGAMWDNAIKQRNVASQIWLSKNLFGWSDKLVHAQGDVSQEKLIINFSGKKLPGQMDSGVTPKENAEAVSEGAGHTSGAETVQSVVPDDGKPS